MRRLQRRPTTTSLLYYEDTEPNKLCDLHSLTAERDRALIDKLGNQVRNLGANDKVDPTLKENIPGLTLGEAPTAGSSGDTSGQADGQAEPRSTF